MFMMSCAVDGKHSIVQKESGKNMRIIFFNTSSMKYYKGSCNQDVPENGGKYVLEHGSGHEQNNYRARELLEGQYCMGFVETKSHGDAKNSLHIERIANDITKKDESAEDVLVIWCAKSNLYGFTVVGWYEHATVYRHSERYEISPRKTQYYYALAKKENCVLLPISERSKKLWSVPRAKKSGFGFGQSLVWYADKQAEQPYVKKIVAAIRSYNSDNWIDASVENESDILYGDAATTTLTSCEEYAEGREILTQHIQRERNQKVVSQAKAEFIKKYGRLKCQICEFDFEKEYGKQGKGFIEAHHTKPVSELKPGDKTRVEDMLLVCPNCHRMIHRQKPWLTASQLKKMIQHPLN